MLHEGAQLNFIRNRPALPTGKSSAEIARDIPAAIRARSFLAARCMDARLLEYYKSSIDDFLTGKIGRDECRNRMRKFARENGFDNGTNALTNLGGTARLNLIINQQAAMAKAVGDHERMYSPEALEAFPYVMYHASVGSRNPRKGHQQYDGLIIDKNDPWLRTHTPPWDFGCKCELEQISAKRAGKHPEKIKAPTPPEKIADEYVNDSGFRFDPAQAFEQPEDLTNLTPVSRQTILRQAEEAVRDEQLGNVGMITAPAISEEKPAPLPNLQKVKDGFDAMKDAARKEIQSVGLDPDDLPDYQAVNRTFMAAGKHGKNIPKDVADKFPKDPFEVAKLNQRATESAGLPADTPVMLGRGNPHNGIEHLWRNHKELFVNPEAAIRLLKETLGNPNCRVVVSLKRAKTKQHGYGDAICLKRIVLHNPKTKTYCVMVWDGNALKLVSWNNADDDYGNSEWALK